MNEIHAEEGIAAILSAAQLTGDPGISFLRAPDGDEQLPQLVLSLADAEHYDLIDDRYIGEDSATYRVQIWTNDRRQLLAIYREILAWFRIWRPQDLFDRLVVEVQQPSVTGGADLVAFTTAVATAEDEIQMAPTLEDPDGTKPDAGFAAQLAALTPLQLGWPEDGAIPQPGEDVDAAVMALESLRGVLPQVTFGVVPVRSMDTPHIGFQDRGVYERNLAILWVPDGS